ncbi:MAG: orotidine-5'-phosphate decarboxylase [Candidatus Omnitrophica bacterium]|nr:orotidine-5'-phosphate decarboxylase [Candidatus Omnitrophota bacterium]
MSAGLIVALDTDDLKFAEQLVESLSPLVKIFKVGSQLFTTAGPDILQRIQQKGAEVFLDLKFHDIPNTVSHAVAAACRYNPLMLTVHALGASQMLAAAAEARNHSGARTKILGITILTSLDKSQLEEIGLTSSVNEEVICLAQMAKAAGLDGIVASPQETSVLRPIVGEEFIIVTPGIRPKGPMQVVRRTPHPSNHPEQRRRDDQRRTMSAQEAVCAGADYLVVGRPITQSPDPLAAAQQIIEEINGAR